MLLIIVHVGLVYSVHEMFREFVISPSVKFIVAS